MFKSGITKNEIDMSQLNYKFIYFICLVSAMGGLLFGYDWVVIGGAKPFYEVFFGISRSATQQGLAMSIALLGCLVGALACGLFAARYGRKPLLIGSAAIFILSAYGTGAAQSYGVFLCARFLGGIGIGLASGLSPMYIAEVAPTKIRGKLVSLNQMAIVIGILGAQVANYLIADKVPAGLAEVQMLATWNCQMGWRWMFWMAGLLAIAFLVLAFLIPESPRWLYLKGRESEAVTTLARIGGEDYARREAQTYRESQADSSAQPRQRLTDRRFRYVLWLGIFIAVFQQWCGTNVIFNYAQEIFTNAGFALSDVLFNIVITGVANLVFTVVALFTIDRWGRRTLMRIGAGGLCLVYLTLGTCYALHLSGAFMVLLVVAAISCYAMTLGPCTWVLISELFPNAIRSAAVATATFALWVGSFTLTFSFPFLNRALGSNGTFWIYSLICLVGFWVFSRYLPETKGKSLEELEKELTK